MQNTSEYTYLFSKKSADRGGYMVGKLEDGSHFKFTRAIRRNEMYQQLMDEYLNNYNDAMVVFNNPKVIVSGSPYVNYSNEKPYIESNVTSVQQQMNECRKKFSNNSNVYIPHIVNLPKL